MSDRGDRIRGVLRWSAVFLLVGCGGQSETVVSGPDASTSECPDAATDTVSYLGRAVPVVVTRRGCPVTIPYNAR
jgi:hypothetical protein